MSRQRALRPLISMDVETNHTSDSCELNIHSITTCFGRLCRWQKSSYKFVPVEKYKAHRRTEIHDIFAKSAQSTSVILTRHGRPRPLSAPALRVGAYVRFTFPYHRYSMGTRWVSGGHLVVSINSGTTSRHYLLAPRYSTDRGPRAVHPNVTSWAALRSLSISLVGFFVIFSSSSPLLRPPLLLLLCLLLLPPFLPPPQPLPPNSPPPTSPPAPRRLSFYRRHFLPRSDKPCYSLFLSLRDNTLFSFPLTLTTYELKRGLATARQDSSAGTRQVIFAIRVRTRDVSL